eukprot:6703446-Prymnesium_polylepis.1
MEPGGLRADPQDTVSRRRRRGGGEDSGGDGGARHQHHLEEDVRKMRRNRSTNHADLHRTR